ncbi:MAG: hypothetical protein AAFZ65_06860, partial [Planctomycetota bacterium]
MKLAPIAVVLASLHARPALADVHIVAAPGEGDFASIAEAVEQAADGDVVFVRWTAPTEGEPVVIRNKSITLVGTPTGVEMSLSGPSVGIGNQLLIEGLEGDQRVVVARLRVAGPGADAATPAKPAVVIRDCRGEVRLQDLSIRGGV